MIHFYFQRATSAWKVSLLGIYGCTCCSVFTVQRAPCHHHSQATDLSISLGLKHNLDVRHFLLNQGKKSTSSQLSDSKGQGMWSLSKRDHQKRVNPQLYRESCAGSGKGLIICKSRRSDSDLSHTNVFQDSSFGNCLSGVQDKPLFFLEASWRDKWSLGRQIIPHLGEEKQGFCHS